VGFFFFLSREKCQSFILRVLTAVCNLLTIHDQDFTKPLVISVRASERLASTSGNTVGFIPECSVTTLSLPKYITDHLTSSLFIVKEKVG
jgi:hypothetical protein